MDLVLIRHARPDVAPGVCYGRSDLPLVQPMSPAPEAIVAVCGPAVPARVITSPLRRARDTAARLAGLLEARVAPEGDERLQELDFGDWEGMAWDDVPRAQVGLWAADLMHARPHGGESAAHAMSRVIAWADALPDDSHDCIWAVAHAGPLRMLAAHWLGVPLAVTVGWELGFGATCGFRLRPGRVEMLWWNRLPEER